MDRFLLFPSKNAARRASQGSVIRRVLAHSSPHFFLLPRMSITHHSCKFSDKQCGQNEEYTDCVPHCETSCRGIQECADKTNATCTPGCTCKPGYRHNGLRKCVLPRHCYLAPGCKDNETWSKCSTCERKCGVESQTCSLCYSGCACNDGYARNSSNICTRIEKCA
ncbi:Trypsin Inhibitor like cysteine rich domain protein [Trichostrongylus colubriformis]|uniref:Trypsin Inhibitor like cysteine rich domain protein n=1 Tax=Trichostrongylus colubriformis TaxID=6319 RepID=A0AAN8EYK3_TRICO